MGTSQSELQDLIAAGGNTDPRRLGGYERLVIDNGQKCRLDNLGIEQGRPDPDDRLVGKKNGALRYGFDRSAKSPPSQVTEKRRDKKSFAIFSYNFV